jgi:hypothetical protein
VVTGKVDVREAATNLLDEPESLDEPDDLPNNGKDLQDDMDDIQEEAAA